jgi:hypothetical protein
MAKLYGTNTSPRGQSPAGQVDGSQQGGHVRVYREKIALAGQTTSDQIVVAYPSKGEAFLYGELTSDTSLATSTVAVGVAGTTGKYRAAATFTVATFVPTRFGAPSAITAFDKLTTDEEVFVTIGTASLPGSGTLFVDLYFTQT